MLSHHGAQVVSRAYRLGATGPVTVETVHVLQGDLPPDLHALCSGRHPAATVAAAGTLSEVPKGPAAAGAELQRAICDLCFRAFASSADAVAHERVCMRNPKNRARLAMDPWKLASIYREIKPPAAAVCSSVVKQESAS